MLLILMAALCLNYEVIDHSGYGTDDNRTKAVITRAIKVCDKRYHGCLAKVVRNTETDYSITCRREEDEHIRSP